MIELTNICKTFRVARRGSGMKSASKALFHREYEKIEALRNVSFTIQDGEMVGYIGHSRNAIHGRLGSGM